MALLIAVGVCLILTGPVALVIAILAWRRVNDLRPHLRHPAARPTALAAPIAPAAAPATVPAAAPAVVRDTASPAVRGPHLDLETLLGGQWLTWIGILALFFGTAFFVGVDLGEHLLSGLPQILIGLGVAVLFNLLGRYWSDRRERVLGLGLLGGGVALLYLACYAAYGFHHLISPWLVFPLLLVVAVVGGMLALGRDSVAIATLTLVGAFFTPILLRSSTDSTFAMLPYLVAMNLGAILVGLRRGWAGLPLGAFAASILLINSWWFASYRPELRLYAFAFVGATWLLHAVSPWLARIHTRFWSAARGLLVVGNGLLFGWFCYLLLKPDLVELQGAAFIALALVYLGATEFFARRQGSEPALRISHDTGIALAVIAVPVQFDLAWVTLAWAALAVVLLWHGLRAGDRGHRLSGLAVLGLVLVRTLFMDNTGLHDPESFLPVMNGGFLGGVAVIVILGLLAWIYRRRGIELSPLEAHLGTPLLLTAVSVLFWKISFEVLAYFEMQKAITGTDAEVQRLLTLSLVWAVYAAAVVGSGFATNFKPLRILGIVLLGITVFKVFLLDIQALDQGYRIAAFVALGLLLLAVSMLYQRRRAHTGETDSTPT